MTPEDRIKALEKQLDEAQKRAQSYEHYTASEFNRLNDKILDLEDLIRWLFSFARVHRLHSYECRCPACKQVAKLESIVGHIEYLPKSIKKQPDLSVINGKLQRKGK